MSVIFKTLKKVRDQLPERNEERKKLRRNWNIYALRKVIVSPLGMLCVGFIIVLSGFIAVYGVRYLTRSIIRSGDENKIVQKEVLRTRKVKKNKEGNDTKKQEIVYKGARDVPLPPPPPPPPETLTFKPAEPGKLYLPATHKNESSKENSEVVRYSPPRSFNEPKKVRRGDSSALVLPTSSVPTSSALSNEDFISEIHEQEQLSTKTISKSFYDEDTLSQIPKIEDTYPNNTPRAYADEDIQTFLFLESDEMVDSETNVQVMESHSEELQEFPYEDPVPFPSSQQDLRDPVRHPDVAKINSERICIANADRTVKVASLVTKIQESIGTEKRSVVNELIDQLAQIKGEHHKYVLKLRAFFYINENDYEKATQLLTEVLSKDGKDLEANINMAILEIRANQTDKAQRRVAKMKQVYPESLLVSELFQKLHR
ncbi:MAG: tetratricopeptide repeat protein [Thermodesulfobacteriota bacterium]|nr:tetratricopeptide repeat protein [Thermodesulfobacteriota bacterium]